MTEYQVIRLQRESYSQAHSTHTLHIHRRIGFDIGCIRLHAVKLWRICLQFEGTPLGTSIFNCEDRSPNHVVGAYR